MLGNSTEEKGETQIVEIGYPIFANLPTYLYPIISDFCKPTYLPNHRISYVDGPIDKKYLVMDKIILSRTYLIFSRTKNILSGQMDRA